MRVAVLTLHHPWRRSHGGTMRTRAIVDALVRLGHDVTCIHPGAAGEAPVGLADVGTGSQPLGQQEWSAGLRALKRRCLPMPTAAGARDRRLAAALAALGPVDLLASGEMAGARYWRSSGARRLWLDLPDLLSSAAARQAAVQGGAIRLTALAQARLLRRSERRLATLPSVAVTAAGWGDAATLAAAAGRPVQWLPTPVAVPAPLPPTAAVRTAGFLGNFAHLPNLDGYQVLCRQWAPRLADSGWAVVVAGHDSHRLPAAPHVERLGPLASVEDFYQQVAISLAPIRLGGGMKVKVVESLAYGRPVVGTEATLEGLPPALQRFVTAVDIDCPDLSSLPAAVPSEARVHLEAFSPERFVDGVARALDGLRAAAPA